MRFEIVDFTF